MISFFGHKEIFTQKKSDYIKIIDNILTNDELLRGNAVTLLEKKVASQCKRKFAIAVNSGTDALIISLKALGIGPGDEVIIPTFSFVASVSPILLLGAKPVFVDVELENCLLDINLIEEAITDKTRGILGVDIFGECLDWEALEKITKKYNLFCLEDGAQSYGSSKGGRPAGSFGDVSTISFDVSKVVYGMTTGGMILTDEEVTAVKCQALRGHGFDPEARDFVYLGYNSQMSSINAAVIDSNLNLASKERKIRTHIAKKYDEYLSEIPQVKILKRKENSDGNFHKYVIFCEARDQLKKFLIGKDVPVKVHYDKPLPKYSGIRCEVGEVKCPNALKISQSILSLPIHHCLNESDIKYICSKIKEFYELN